MLKKTTFGTRLPGRPSDRVSQTLTAKHKTIDEYDKIARKPGLSPIFVMSGGKKKLKTNQNAMKIFGIYAS
jgi:hypothetical protein